MSITFDLTKELESFSQPCETFNTKVSELIFSLYSNNKESMDERLKNNEIKQDEHTDEHMQLLKSLEGAFITWWQRSDAQQKIALFKDDTLNPLSDVDKKEKEQAVKIVLAIMYQAIVNNMWVYFAGYNYYRSSLRADFLYLLQKQDTKDQLFGKPVEISYALSQMHLVFLETTKDNAQRVINLADRLGQFISEPTLGSEPNYETEENMSLANMYQIMKTVFLIMGLLYFTAAASVLSPLLTLSLTLSLSIGIPLITISFAYLLVSLFAGQKYNSIETTRWINRRRKENHYDNFLDLKSDYHKQPEWQIPKRLEYLGSYFFRVAGKDKYKKDHKKLGQEAIKYYDGTDFMPKEDVASTP